MCREQPAGMLTNRIVLASFAAAVVGCGPEPKQAPSSPAQATPPPAATPYVPPTTTPTKQEQLDAARGQVEAALEASHQVRTALELLGVLPTYTCGEPRRLFVGRVVGELTARVACVTATTEAEGDTADVVRLAFAPGCRVQGHAVTGDALFRYSGGEDRLSLEADLRSLQVDGETINARVGYGTCGDEKRVWASSQGTLPRRADVSYSVDVQVGIRSSNLPLIGGTTLVLDGPAEVRTAQGANRVTFTGLEYEVGEYLPKNGELLIETADGHSVKASFSSLLWRVGHVEVSVDGGEKVTLPVVH